jgi:hypothetical protein
MAHLLTLIFSADQINELMALEPDEIRVVSTVEEVVLQDGSPAGAVKVMAYAYRSGNEEPIGSVDGCPRPPC